MNDTGCTANLTYSIGDGGRYSDCAHQDAYFYCRRERGHEGAHATVVTFLNTDSDPHESHDRVDGRSVRMTDADAWEAYCAAGEEPPFICNECGAAIDRSDITEAEEHRMDHWFEWLRSQCPIPPAPIAAHPRFIEADDEAEETPF